MTLSRLSLFCVRTAFSAAAVAILGMHATIAQQNQVRQLPNPPLPITPAHPNPAPGTRPISPNSSPGPASSLNTATWTAIGPASLNNNGFNATSSDLVSGRITGIAVDPTNSNTIYVAAAGGGVWKTTDGGTNWTPLTDNQPDLAMGAIAIAPSNHLRLYAGTGEANNSLDANHGEGILVSSDGGSTWTLENPSGVFTGVSIGQIAVDPTNADVAYAAVGGFPQNGNNYTNEGIWKTSDGGTTWTNVTAAASLTTQDSWSAVVVDPNTPTIVYAAIGDFYSGATTNGIYRSTDSGSTWALLSNAPHGTDTNLGRIALAVSPAANVSGKHVLYIVSANTSNYGLGYFLRSANADSATPTFTNLASSTPDFLGSANNPGQGWYDIAINVDANGNVYCAGVVDYGTQTTKAIITSTDTSLGGGSPTWTDITVVNSFEPHSDNHAIAFDSSNNMLVGGDGGIFRYNPTSPAWTDLNGNLNITQFEGIGLHPTDPNTVLGGSQDNGTELYSDNLLWSQVRAGDGGPARISQTNGSVCYHEYTGNSIERSSDGCHSWTAINSLYQISGANFYPPYTVDPTNGDHLLYGTDLVNESTNGGTSWNYISDPGFNGFNSGTTHVDSIALSPANGPNPQVVYAATGGAGAVASQIFVTNNDGGAWTEIDLPSCTQNGNAGIGCGVYQIVTDPNDPTGHTAVAVTDKFSSSGSSHVFRTTNMGTGWTDITGNLPNLPTWSVVVDTDPAKTIYISNETSVWSSPSPYTSWTQVGTGLPHAQGLDLELNSSLRILGVATHGRGAWEIETPAHVTNVTSTAANGTYSINATIPIKVTFNAPVTVTGAPHLALSTKPTVSATYASGTGTNTLTFNYVVGSGQTTTGDATGGHLDYESTSALSLNGGSIKDASSTPAELTLYAPGATGSLSANKSIAIVAAAALTSPTPGALSGPKVTFTWSGATGASAYKLWIGTTSGANNLYSSGSTTATSVTVSNLPTNGETIYVSLVTVQGSTQVLNKYTFTAAAQGAITSPTPSTVLAGPNVTFNWSASSGATGFRLWIGTSVGSENVYSSGLITAKSATPTALPTNGETLHVRLYTYFGSYEAYTDYTYTAATQAGITSPTPGTQLSGAQVTFNWSAGTGATAYKLWIGTSPKTNNVFTSGSTTAKFFTAKNLPTNGETLYVTLVTVYGSNQVYAVYTYTAAP